ncbi:MAG TPA: succinylglutamate desuccinylase/aspartoacylase family protein [Acetomicrobium sp.]|uniref:succinylglutamate desuccinylase/aspartoacylase family protein n=1 Tax=Acetomicrobium mobile TaxID=97477 RepID=UPI0026F06F39|nr:succinylglutamate desuccinylase/aspartoacylase family protein [Acetomicrobium mobile]HOB10921.1 succinylglutamate desuccinylase/aspartoacylase family protein [Acetomicrobium sp.]HQA36746.1 succinylglutamate desuccinylase/aspartoacylase family protein [Acetomicrobium sp.]
MNIKGTRKTAIFLLTVALLVMYVTGRNFLAMRQPDVVIPADGFEKRMLSDWFQGIGNTPADTPVFIQEGQEPGGTVLILGGTHPNEPAGYIAAVLFLERAQVQKGRLIVIPFANNTAFTHNSPQEGYPQYIRFLLPDGSVRTFRYGSRDTNPVYQWPDPDIYVHEPSGQRLAGSEMRNLNRAYPGQPHGVITQRIAFAILELIRKEDVDLAFDLHEASPEYPVVNAIVAHEKSLELGAMAAMDLEGRGIPFRLEPSPRNLRGLSHREWGDHTDVMAILMETGNPIQGRLRGRTNEALALTGKDKFYQKAAKLGSLFIPYEDDQPIALRTARHVTAIMTFLEMLGFISEEKSVIVNNIPDYNDIIDKGIEAFLLSIS